jgi:hypothetical protein
MPSFPDGFSFCFSCLSLLALFSARSCYFHFLRFWFCFVAPRLFGCLTALVDAVFVCVLFLCCCVFVLDLKMRLV